MDLPPLFAADELHDGHSFEDICIWVKSAPGVVKSRYVDRRTVIRQHYYMSADAVKHRAKIVSNHALDEGDLSSYIVARLIEQASLVKMSFATAVENTLHEIGQYHGEWNDTTMLEDLPTDSRFLSRSASRQMLHVALRNAKRHVRTHWHRSHDLARPLVEHVSSAILWTSETIRRFQQTRFGRWISQSSLWLAMSLLATTASTFLLARLTSFTAQMAQRLLLDIPGIGWVTHHSLFPFRNVADLVADVLYAWASGARGVLDWATYSVLPGLSAHRASNTTAVGYTRLSILDFTTVSAQGMAGLNSTALHLMPTVSFLELANKAIQEIVPALRHASYPKRDELILRLDAIQLQTSQLQDVIRHFRQDILVYSMAYQHDLSSLAVWIQDVLRNFRPAAAVRSDVLLFLAIVLLCLLPALLPVGIYWLWRTNGSLRRMALVLFGCLYLSLLADQYVCMYGTAGQGPVSCLFTDKPVLICKAYRPSHDRHLVYMKGRIDRQLSNKMASLQHRLHKVNETVEHGLHLCRNLEEHYRIAFDEYELAGDHAKNVIAELEDMGTLRKVFYQIAALRGLQERRLRDEIDNLQQLNGNLLWLTTAYGDFSRARITINELWVHVAQLRQALNLFGNRPLHRGSDTAATGDEASSPPSASPAEAQYAMDDLRKWAREALQVVARTDAVQAELSGTTQQWARMADQRHRDRFECEMQLGPGCRGIELLQCVMRRAGLAAAKDMDKEEARTLMGRFEGEEEGKTRTPQSG